MTQGDIKMKRSGIGLLRRIKHSAPVLRARIVLHRLRSGRLGQQLLRLRQRLPGSARPHYGWRELRRMQRTAFRDPPRISLLVPLYRTPRRYLRAMIRSVRRQAYPHWELCLADGSGGRGLSDAVSRYSKGDTRIRYCRLAENLGISENTNAALALATGDYLALLDHDDLLDRRALFCVASAIAESGADLLYTDEATFRYTPLDAFCAHYKPDFSPDLLRSYNYICHLAVFSKGLLDRARGGLRREYDGSQDYDLLLRLSEKAECIRHIPQVLYYWRAHKGSVAADPKAKPYAVESAKRALEAHLARMGLSGRVEEGRVPTTYRIRYTLSQTPLVSLLVPSSNACDLLARCLDSVTLRTTYPRYEILVVENNTSPEQLAFYEALPTRYPQVRLLHFSGEFDYSAINNFALAHAKGEYVILLNNDVEILTPSWIEEMLMLGQREDVGAVGALLYYPDDTVQHAGVILGIGGIAGHAHKHFPRGATGYFSRLAVVQDLSAVTGACMMVRASLLRALGGLCPSLPVAFNDVDLCLRIRREGYLVAFTPYAEAYHHESLTRGAEDTPEKQARFLREIAVFKERWGEALEKGDPYYHPRLTLLREDFSPKRGREG